MNTKLIFVYAYSSLHPGTGQGVGVIDLPVAREVATGLPYLPGSSLKGVLRDRCPAATRVKVFGPETNNADAHAGAALFTDQRLLLFPTRSLAGTMAWVTSPFVLQRFQRDCVRLGLDAPADIPTIAGEDPLTAARVTADSALVLPAGGRQLVVLEDLDLTAQRDSDESGAVSQWADWLKMRLFPNEEDWQKTLAQRLCVVHDDTLSFLLDTATEVIARNQLTEEKTSGNLWYEEALPAETVLSGLVLAQQVGADGMAPEKVLAELEQLVVEPVQLGGHATIGRGICRVIIGG